MNKFCIVINDGETYDTMHWTPDPRPHSLEVDRWIVSYFADHAALHLSIDNDTICEIVGEFEFEVGKKLYVIKNINSDELATISRNGISMFEDNKGKFFDGVFK